MRVDGYIFFLDIKLTIVLSLKYQIRLQPIKLLAASGFAGSWVILSSLITR